MPPKTSKTFQSSRIYSNPAARQLGVDERRISEWIVKEAAFRTHASKRRRLEFEGGGRKPDHHQQVEEELAL